MSVIIYNKNTQEVFNRYERANVGSDHITRGYLSESDDFWQGYAPSLFPEIYELTPSQEAAWDPTKLYSFDPITKTLTEHDRPKTPEEIMAEQLERIEAQSTYTAMMTDTLI